MAKHARLSPSSSVRWLSCLASPVMEAGKPNTSNRYAAEGTAAHWVAEQTLLNGHDSAFSFKGKNVVVFKSGDCGISVTDKHNDPEAGQYSFKVDGDMVDYIDDYVSLVRSVRDATAGELLVEERLTLEDMTGEKGAKGTADAVILADREIVVIDLKFGQGIQVEAADNSQLMMYGLAALNEYEMAGDFETVRLIISQPRRYHTSEWTIPAEELRAWGRKVRDTADIIHGLNDDSDLSDLFEPSDAACKYCKAAGECKAYAEAVHKTVMADFDSLDDPLTVDAAKYEGKTLAEMYRRVDLVKGWAKTIEDVTFEKLKAGEPVGDLKLVQGRGGARKWLNEEQADEMLRRFKLRAAERVKEKIASPTDVEKLVKAGRISSAQWENIQQLIIKSEGRPVVADASDKREAINPADIFVELN